MAKKPCTVYRTLYCTVCVHFETNFAEANFYELFSYNYILKILAFLAVQYVLTM